MGVDAGKAISIHAPREGSDFDQVIVRLHPFFISIHAPREGSDHTAVTDAVSHCISIHAPREGSDALAICSISSLVISIHAPREGSDPKIVCTGPGKPTFQSTLPVRGATTGFLPVHMARDISIHAPREGSDNNWKEGTLPKAISIHAPREGSDRSFWCCLGGANHFNPRSP